jgi:hypothetical protein
MFITRICFSLIKITKFNVFPFKKHFYKAEKFPHKMILFIMTHSDVAEYSVEGIDLMSIYSDLGEIKKSLQATCTKTDLESAVNCLVKQSDLNDLVNTFLSIIPSRHNGW